VVKDHRNRCAETRQLKLSDSNRRNFGWGDSG
jgi:hypothetical protein